MHSSTHTLITDRHPHYSHAHIHTLLTPMPVFSPQSRDELKRAVIGVYSEGNRPTMVHGPISKWDVSQVTDMRTMFYEIDTFNYELSLWDVSRVTNMREMFAGAHSFNQALCGAAWVNSDALEVDMFTHSLGFISNTVCGT